MNPLIKLTVWLAVCLAFVASSQAATQIALTKHNLTPSGPGTIRTTQPTGLCVFCHTPHKANGTIALWNRDLSPATYKIYSSSTLVSVLNQPTGSSRLCLSCHDGTLALDNLRLPPKGGLTAMGVLTGSTVLGTDLSSSHPISFTYDSTLAVTRGELVDPIALPKGLQLLDINKQMQCTSCHDPHEDKQVNFLRADNRAGALCTACHNLTGWRGAAHATSVATWSGSGTNPWPAGAYTTVADNACNNCHLSHSAAHPERLLAQSIEPANCTNCHSGTVATNNVANEFLKPYHHPIEGSQWTHLANENPSTMLRHVTCVDCHNSHVATSATAVPPYVSGALLGVKSVNQSGGTIPSPSFEYEVCNKCHGLTEPTTIGLTRASASRNIRMKIDPLNPSFHPIAAPGTNLTVSGFQVPYTAASQIGCISCHNTDSSTGIPRGPHGSINEWILAANYTTADSTPESPQAYALCYQCHNETYLITNQAKTFPHNTHLSTTPGVSGTFVNASCATCHDAHGSRQNAHLIDFMLRDRNGTVVVSPNSLGVLNYVSLGVGHGQCNLACHGHDHIATATTSFY